MSKGVELFQDSFFGWYNHYESLINHHYSPLITIDFLEISTIARWVVVPLHVKNTPAVSARRCRTRRGVHRLFLYVFVYRLLCSGCFPTKSAVHLLNVSFNESKILQIAGETKLRLILSCYSRYYWNTVLLPRNAKNLFHETNVSIVFHRLSGYENDMSSLPGSTIHEVRI